MRTFIRQPSNIPVEISSREIPANKNQLLKNISFGGLCYQTDKPIKTGTTVNIRLPSLGPEFETQGRVSWCRRKNFNFEAGIQFLDKNKENQLYMVEQVCDIERCRKQDNHKLQKQLH